MKALSIKQPWAWLICAGYKDIENRDWFIGRKPALGGRFQNRGLELPSRIYVHTGKIADLNALVSPHLAELLRQGKLRLPLSLDIGAIIGEVDITGCVDKSDSLWFTGKYGFTLANPALYDKPIPYPGQLGFFEIPEEVIHGQKV